MFEPASFSMKTFIPRLCGEFPETRSKNDSNKSDQWRCPETWEISPSSHCQQRVRNTVCDHRNNEEPDREKRRPNIPSEAEGTQDPNENPNEIETDKETSGPGRQSKLLRKSPIELRGGLFDEMKALE